MPNLNKGDLIEAAIRSVLEQTIKNLELVIVDDASTDTSSEIARRYAEKDARITLIRHTATRGVSAARNTGIREARGAIIGFIDSDDTYAPSKLEKQLDALDKERVPAVIYCDFGKIDAQGKELPPDRRPHYKKDGMIFGDILEYKFGIKATILLPKVCFQKVGLFDESLPLAEDLDMVLRLSWLYPFRCLDEKLYSYRISPGNTEDRLSQSSINFYRALVIERHYRRTSSTLTRDQKRTVGLNLTVLYSRSSHAGKTIRYGLSSYDSLRYLLIAPFRGHGLRQVLHLSKTD
ncbi:MAG: glycosyltransferase [Thaumarchaeota archaeon]|nr:glycosyltransferase [Nitrososphaerota archaeon]